MAESMTPAPLGTEKDKLGISVELHYCPVLGGTDNLIYFMKNFASGFFKSFVFSSKSNNRKNIF